MADHQSRQPQLGNDERRQYACSNRERTVWDIRFSRSADLCWCDITRSKRIHVAASEKGIFWPRHQDLLARSGRARGSPAAVWQSEISHWKRRTDCACLSLLLRKDILWRSEERGYKWYSSADKMRLSRKPEIRHNCLERRYSLKFRCTEAECGFGTVDVYERHTVVEFRYRRFLWRWHWKRLVQGAYRAVVSVRAVLSRYETARNTQPSERLQAPPPECKRTQRRWQRAVVVRQKELRDTNRTC